MVFNEVHSKQGVCPLKLELMQHTACVVWAVHGVFLVDTYKIVIKKLHIKEDSCTDPILQSPLPLDDLAFSFNTSLAQLNNHKMVI